MAIYTFETENPSQLLRVIEGFEKLGVDVVVKENKEINPFESSSLVKVEIDASFEQILENLAATKNSATPLETIRPLQ